MGVVHLSKYFHFCSLFIMMASLLQAKWKSSDWTCIQSHCTFGAMWDGCNQPGFLPAAVLQYCSGAHASAHAAYEIARCKPGWMVLTWTNLACHRLQRCTSTAASAACCSEVKSAFDERLHVGSWVRWLWREPTWPGPLQCCTCISMKSSLLQSKCKNWPAERLHVASQVGWL